MLLYDYYPYISYGTPNEVSVEKLHPSSLEDYGTDVVETKSLILIPSKIIEVTKIDGKYYLSSNGRKYQEDLLALETDDLVTAKISYYNSSDAIKDKFFTIYGEMPDKYFKNLNDAKVESPQTNEAVKGIVSSQPASFLKTYIKSYSKTTHPQVPLLVGQSGVGKSALMKGIVNSLKSEWGYRLVTLKASFLDKSDLLGFVSTGEVTIAGQKEMIAQDAPMKELLTGTDVFVATCRTVIAGVEKPDDLSPEEKDVYEKLKEYAKTPIFFWDEINRVEASMMKQLMVIFNQKRLNQYTWENVPMVAAANWVVEADDEEKLEDMYSVEGITDPAIIDRFSPIVVSHKDQSILLTTKKYLVDTYQDQTKINLNNLLGLAIDNEYFFNPNFFESSESEDLDKDKLTYERKFPTFRGWEYVIQYLISKSDNVYFSDMIASLLGYKATMELMKSGNSEVVLESSFMDYTDLQSLVLGESYNAGIPCLLTGKFGIAKTAKINQIAKEKGAEIHNIDLSAMDKTTLRGFPKKMSLTSVVLGFTSTDLGNKFEEVSQELPTFPRFTTGFIPFDFRYKVEECLRTNTPLIVSFDEINRVSSNIQSAVFDAISEHQIQGVDISELHKRGLIRIVAAGNVGDDYDVESLDAATMARFAAVRKDSIDSHDIEAFLQWAFDKLHPDLYSSLAEDPEAIKELLNSEQSLDDINISSKLNSFRSFETLSSFLVANKGFLLNFDTEGNVSFSDAELVSIVENKNYLGLEYGDLLEITINGEDFLFEELPLFVELLKENNALTPEIIEEIAETIRESDSYFYENVWLRGIQSVISDDKFFQSLLSTFESQTFDKYMKVNTTTTSIANKILLGISDNNVNVKRIDATIENLVKTLYNDDSGEVTSSQIISDIKEVYSKIAEVYPIGIPNEQAIKVTVRRIKDSIPNYKEDVDFSDLDNLSIILNGISESPTDDQNLLPVLANSFDLLSIRVAESKDSIISSIGLGLRRSGVFKVLEQSYDELESFFYKINPMIPNVLLVYTKTPGDEETYEIKKYQLKEDFNTKCLKINSASPTTAIEAFLLSNVSSYGSVKINKQREVHRPEIAYSDLIGNSFLVNPIFDSKFFAALQTEKSPDEVADFINTIDGIDSTKWIEDYEQTSDLSVDLFSSTMMGHSERVIAKAAMDVSIPLFKKDLVMFSKFIKKLFKS